MTYTDLILGVASALLSLAFSYVPGLKTHYDLYEPEQKRLIMGACLLIATAAIYGASCLDLWPAVACTSLGIKELVQGMLWAIVTNQSVYRITKPTDGGDR